MALQDFFIWGQGGEKMTPQQVERQRRLADELGQAAMDYSPVQHWSQGAARAAQGLLSGLKTKQADKAETAGMERAQSVIEALLGGAGSSGSPGPGFATGNGTPTFLPDPAMEMGLNMGTPAQGGEQLPGAGFNAGTAAGDIRQGLISRGLPEHVADAFIMNFQDESGLDPSINEVAPLVEGSRGGFGLAQWTGPRRKALEQFAASRGTSPADTNTQLDFLMTELQGPESRAAQSILSAPDTGSAAAAIVNDFLRPAEQHRTRRVAEYTGGGAMPAGGGLPQQDSGVIGALLAAGGDPWVAQQYGPVIEALMGQQMARQNAVFEQQLQQSDPMYQAKLAQLTTPEAPKPIEVGGVLLDPTTYQPIFDSRQNDGGFTLSPGQQRFDAQGNAIASGAPVEAPRPMTPEERAQWGIPADDARPYAMTEDGPKLIGGSGVTVNNDLGGDKFEEAFAKGDAAALGAVSESGLAAQRNLARIDEMEQLLSRSPTGLAGVAKQKAGEWGIATEGLDDIQAAQALINAMVPEQRPPGSGPMSDADLELFKQSLPRIINQPGGNEQIIKTMRGIAQYDAMGAQIVQRLRAGEISRAEAFQQLQSRPNPLQGFTPPQSGADASRQSNAEMPADFKSRFGSVAEQNGITIEQLWEAWPK